MQLDIVLSNRRDVWGVGLVSTCVCYTKCQSISNHTLHRDASAIERQFMAIQVYMTRDIQFEAPITSISYSILIEMQLLPHKPSLRRFLTTLLFLRTHALQRMKQHTSIEESI